MLYKSDVEYVNYATNHVLGCAHGCMFPCYAFNLKRRCGQVCAYDEWRQPRIVENTLELLDREIPRLKGIEWVHLCFATDPFMVGYPEVSALSLATIATLHAAGIRVQTLTKGITPHELTDTKTYGDQNLYGITLVSIDETFRQRYEPYTAPYAEHIEALKMLH